MTIEKISEAIIIHGPGRSGTTLLSNILSLHPDLAWISGYVNRFPTFPALSVLNKVQSYHWLERLNRGRRKWPRPAEAYGFWTFYFPSFSNSKLPIAKRKERPDRCIKTIKSILSHTHKERFITKITGGSRAVELSQIFSNPYVIYINRDPRAVVMSYYKQRWGYKNKPEIFASKDKKALIQEYVQRYLCCCNEMEKLKQFRFLYVAYEDLVNDPVVFFKKLTSFVNLEYSSRFECILNSWSIEREANDAWKRSLTEEEVLYLESQLSEIRQRLGYP